MKVSVQEEKKAEQLEVVILCQKRTPFVNQLAKRIRQVSVVIIGKDEDNTIQIPIDDVYYFEWVKDRTFIHCDEKLYSCEWKLGELEAKLEETSFEKIDRTCFLNLDKVESARGMINGRLLLTLDNGIKRIVARNYILQIKDRMESMYS